MKVVITGANGFVGSSLIKLLVSHNHEVIPVVRRQTGLNNEVIVSGFGSSTDWNPILRGCDVVVHLAARVHVMNENLSDPLSIFRSVNVDGTLTLARQASECGVRRFVFISSVKVNGEETTVGKPFTADDPVAPEDFYAISKAEAEAGLKKICHKSNMELVIIRPPLVYGRGVKGNFAHMMRMVSMRLPLPLGAANSNKRSLVGITNLTNFIETCLFHPSAAGHVFLVSDGDDVSTSDLIKKIASAQGRSINIFWVPLGLIGFVCRITNKESVMRRLFGTLQVDIEKNYQVLGWKPVLNLDEELRKL